MDAHLNSLIDSIPEMSGKHASVEPLHGGITNRNYLVKTADDQFVLRIAGENSGMLGIDRAVEYASARAAFQVGVGPEVIAFVPEYRAMITRFVAGTVLSEADVRTLATLEEVVGALHRFHDSSGGGGTFSAFQTIRRYSALARQHGVEFPVELPPALETLCQIEAALGPPERVAPCHNDLLPANFIRTENRVWILDWEYAGVGDIFFDLANLASNSQFGRAEETLLLRLYFGKVHSADLSRLRLMRLVSDLRESMWGFLQIGISGLDFDYRAYALQHLRRFLTASSAEPSPFKT